MSAKTLYDKLWDSHVVRQEEDGTALIYIDRQLLHEVTSPQAFEGLRLANRKPWRVNANLATPDHNVPTTPYKTVDDIADPISRIQVQTLDANTKHFGITEFGIGDIRQGIVHVVGPEEGMTLPGITLVCGDSHTATHGALGALAHGCGNVGSGARSGHAVLDSKENEKHADQGGRSIAAGGHTERCGLGDYRQNRYRRRQRSCYRIRRTGVPGYVDRRAYDRV